MAGYQRQSAADIVPTAVVRAAPINNELNALRDAFLLAGGHRHDGSATEGAHVPLIADADALNKVVVDTTNNRVGVFVEVGAAAVEQVRVQDGAIVPVTTNDIDLGTNSLKFKDLQISGTATVAGLIATTADINGGTIDAAVIGATTPAAATVTSFVAATADINGGTVDAAVIGASSPAAATVTNLTVNTAAVIASADINGGTIDATTIGASIPAAATLTNLTVNTAATIASADINAGTIDGAVIGGSSAQAITGTTITASTGFVGGLTGAVTGNTAGTHTGPVIGAVTGDVTGNISAASGTSTFNDVTINGGLNMNAGTAATITNLTAPTNSGDAATKGYVDTANALKLNLSGGTMSGAIAMGTNKITGLGTPTLTADAATKGYVDTSISNLVAAAPGALDTLDELAAALGDDANFATTVTNSIATKLPLAGGTMSGAIAMGTSKITGMGNPTLAQDAATKTYVDTADALKLNLSGGTMSGAIAMGTSKITGLGDPTANQDAATKTYVDTADALKLSLSGGTMSGAIAMGTSKITGMGDPTLAQDAATKNYIDVLFGSTSSAAASAAAAATSASNAATSASAASTSASNASTSATAAAASYDSFDDRYLGPKASAPSVDNDGNALLTGALYWNSTSNELYLWTGSAWTQATLTAANFVDVVNNQTVAGVKTFSSSPIVSALTASQAVFTDGSKGLVSNAVTGTGNVVMSTSPTLVTPALGTPSALVGTNITGTASGLTAGNVTTNANLTGDVTSVGNATSIAAGVIVDADINASAAIVDTKLATISTAGKVSNSATTATNANTASAIVARDASGNFTAGTITAALTGNASGSAATFTSTSQNSQFNSVGVGTAGSGTAGEIRATNNITAYYSDDRFKTNLGNIPDALSKVKTLNGFYYEANELAQSYGYEKKLEVGVSAQQVEAVMPEVVAPAPIDENYLTVRYERLVPLLIEAIKELNAKVDALEKTIAEK